MGHMRCAVSSVWLPLHVYRPGLVALAFAGGLIQAPSPMPPGSPSSPTKRKETSRRLYEFVAELDQSHDSILAFIEANCRHAGGKSSDAKVKTLAGTLHALAWMYASIVFDM